jgi:hydroxymethylbilane synthase
MHAALQPLEDRDTRMAITAERRCLAALGGGCLVPIGAYCHRDGDELSCAPWSPPPTAGR